MPSLSDMPVEILNEIVCGFTLRDTISLGSTCSRLHAALQIEKFFWLVRSFDAAGETQREQRLQSTSIVALSHYLLYRLQTRRFEEQSSHEQGPSDRRAESPSDIELLARHGATLSWVSCGSYLRNVWWRHGGPSPEFNFMLRCGASFSQIPSGGAGELLRQELELRGLGDNVTFLFEHDLSLDDINPDDLERLVADYLVDGPSKDDELALLRAHGCVLKHVPKRMDQLYGRLEDVDGWDDSDYSSYVPEDFLDRIVDIFSDLAQHAPPGVVENELIRVFLRHLTHPRDPGALRDILRAQKQWNMRYRGIDDDENPVPAEDRLMIALIRRGLDIEAVKFLLQFGTDVNETFYDKEHLLYRALEEFGPGQEVNLLIHNYGASFQTQEAVMDALQRIYPKDETGQKVKYLEEHWDAEITQVPEGLPKMLECTALQQGLDSPSVNRLLSEFDTSWLEVPCGLPTLLCAVISDPRYKREDIERQCHQPITVLRDDQLGLDLVLEAVFRRWATHLKLLGLLLELGASLNRVPGGKGELIDHTFLKRGDGADLDYLLKETNTTIRDSARGVNALLKEEILSTNQNSIEKTLGNCEYLLSHGASVCGMPGGADNILFEVLIRFHHGPRAKWLLKHGAPANILEEWQARNPKIAKQQYTDAVPRKLWRLKGKSK